MWVWRVYRITLIWKIEGFKRKRLRSPRRRNPALRPAFRLKLQHQFFLDYQPAGPPCSPHNRMSQFLKRVYLHIYMHMYTHTCTLSVLFVWRTLMPLPRNPFSKILPIHAQMTRRRPAQQAGLGILDPEHPAVWTWLWALGQHFLFSPVF